MIIRENFEFYEGQQLVFEFEQLLEKHGIRVSGGCDLESKFLSVFDVLFHFEDQKKYREIDATSDDRSLFRDFNALYDLSLKILSVQTHTDFKQLVPHLKTLNSCSIAQNFGSIITDQNANKIIELYIGSLCMRFCNRVLLDHPEHSVGNNPDVIAEYNGQSWGFACKTIHTRNSQTIYENIKKAISQIESSHSTTGIPIINLKNIVDHNRIWPEFLSYFQTEDSPLSFLSSDVHSIIQSLECDIGVESLNQLFTGRKSLHGILFIAQSIASVCSIKTGFLPTPTPIKLMKLYAIGEFNDEDIEVFDKLNHFMQLAN